MAMNDDQLMCAAWQVQSHVSFLHEELQKLPSFPRKALEADFGLYNGEFGKEVFGVDMLHKFVWAKVSFCDCCKSITGG